MTSIAVIGGGKIGEALVSGLIASGASPKDIRVTNRRSERGQELKEKYGIIPLTENVPAVDDADVVFLCVKPKDIVRVTEEISSAVDNNDSTTVVSMAAGISNSAIEEVLSAGSPVIRVMPNTPMLVGKGMSAVAPGRFASEEQVEEVVKLLETIGAVRVVAESDMDAVTAMSGSSPAYLFLVVESLIDAGINQGLTRDVAKDLAVNAMYGAAAMLKETGTEPSELRANVSSPAGTTIAAIRELEESGIRGAFYRAAEKCAERSKQLGG